MVVVGSTSVAVTVVTEVVFSLIAVAPDAPPPLLVITGLSLIEVAVIWVVAFAVPFTEPSLGVRVKAVTTVEPAAT